MELSSLQFNTALQWWWLLGATLLMLVTYRISRHSVAALLLRLVSLVVLLIALGDPVYLYDNTRTSKLSLLVDISDSMTTAEIKQGLDGAKRYLNESIEITPFAEQPVLRGSYELGPSTDTSALAERLNELTSAAGSRTNLELGLKSVDADVPTELLLVSDGNENVGQALSTIDVLKLINTRVFPIVASSRAINPEFKITRSWAPLVSNAGDAVELRATVRNSFDVSQQGRLEIYLEGEKLHTEPVTVAPQSESLVTFKTPPLKAGAREFSFKFTPENSERKASELKRWVSVKERAKVLLIANAEEDSRLLSQILKSRGYPFEEHTLRDGETPPADLENTAAVVLANVPRAKLSTSFLNQLKSYVSSGGGLIISGGDKSFGLGGYAGSSLEELSPLKSVPPQTEKKRLKNAIVLVVDKSGSMLESSKMDYTKRAAMTAVSALKDEDYMGIVAFDSNPFVILDLKEVRTAKLEMERRLLNLTPVGQTNLLPGLAFARIQLQRAPGTRKHLIVLSDGKIPLTDSTYVNEINNLRKDGITVSTIALGGDADVPFMKLLAQYGKGVFYHVNDPSQLPRIFVEDIKVSTGEKTIKEQELFPVSQTVYGSRVINLSPYPQLKGFVETVKKEGAELELEISAGETPYPLQASWRVEKGAVIAFASDSSGRWSGPWISWENFTKFWTTAVERVRAVNLKTDSGVDFDLNSSVEGDTLKLDLAIFDPDLSRKSAGSVSAAVTTPSGKSVGVVFNETAPGRFTGEIRDAAPGNYRTEIRYRDTKFPPILFSVDSELFGERRGEPINLPLLSQLAQRTGGKVNPGAEDITLRTLKVSKSLSLTPYLLSLAFVLIIVEALIRERRSAV